MVYSLEDLKKAYNKGQHYKFLFFWGHTPDPRGRITETCLSQWWMARFEIEGITYSCAEQFMMAEKARMFHDKEMLSLILGAKHPKAMKAYGRSVRNFNQEIWENSCYDIVKKASMAKFSQNRELWEFLRSTKNRILAEASPRDRIWGIGMGKSNPDAKCPVKWKGSNLLGFALTEARDILMEQEKEG